MWAFRQCNDEVKVPQPLPAACQEKTTVAALAAVILSQRQKEVREPGTLQGQGSSEEAESRLRLALGCVAGERTCQETGFCPKGWKGH